MNKKTKLGIVLMMLGMMVYVPFAIISYSVASSNNTIAGMTAFLIGGYLFIAGEDLFKRKNEGCEKGNEATIASSNNSGNSPSQEPKRNCFCVCATCENGEHENCKGECR